MYKMYKWTKRLMYMGRML